MLIKLYFRDLSLSLNSLKEPYGFLYKKVIILNIPKFVMINYIFLNDQLVPAEYDAIGQEGAKHCENANKGPQLQLSHICSDR